METKIKVDGRDAIISPLNKKHHRIQPRKEIPKSWEKIGIYSYSMQNSYNQSGLEIFKSKDGSLRFATYRDGCFYQYMGKFEWINQ